jgi:CheY-like chemotaxis protein
MKTKIMLIDDERDILTLIAKRLKALGYETNEVLSGEKALEIIKNDKPDIVVLDYMMPGLDGIETLRQIRKIDRKLPVIMMTAYPDQKSIEGSSKLGIIAYVPKLSMFESLEKSLMSAIGLAEKKIGK